MYEVDVLIAGGGVAGALSASRLSSYGFKCLLVEPVGLAAEQSGHSHGYIHRGFIYLRAERALVDKLKIARELWEEYLTKPKAAAFHNSLSLVGFENPNVARYAVQTWSNAGLPVNPIKRRHFPAELIESRISALYRTDEASFDFTKVLSNVISAGKNIETAQGAVKRLILKKSFCRGVEIEIDGAIRKVAARYVILAGGTGNAAILLNSLGHFTAAPSVRTSYMLIAKGESLKSLSLILPENPFYGLFMVSRQERGEGVWLISNYLSYGGICGVDSIAARSWTRATRRVLRSLFPILENSDVRWGIYLAPKAELRRDPSRLPDGNVIESFGIKNASVVWPTKLTLGPLIIQDLVAKIADTLKNPETFQSPEKPLWISDTINVCEENWRGVELLSQKDFEKKMEL